MCCGNKVVANQQDRVPASTFIVLDASGVAVDAKTSEIAAKLAAARIGGTVEKRTPTP